MEDLARRLKELRSELKLTQDQLGEACGVRRRAQTAYEAGDRIPDAEYLVRAGRAGVDIKYLLTGVRATAQERETLAQEWLVRSICGALGVPPQLADEAISRAVAIEAGQAADLGKEAAMQELAESLLRRSRRLNDVEVSPSLDRDLLTDVIREQEAAWDRNGKHPSPVQKSHRIATLYAAAAESGALDPELVEGSRQAPAPAKRNAA